MRNNIATLKAGMRALIRALNTTDLCIEWNLSSTMMENAAEGRSEEQADERKQELAQIRDFLLEEFERRDPKAYRAWFEDDDAADDPSRFYKSSEPSKFRALTV